MHYQNTGEWVAMAAIFYHSQLCKLFQTSFFLKTKKAFVSLLTGVVLKALIQHGLTQLPGKYFLPLWDTKLCY